MVSWYVNVVQSREHIHWGLLKPLKTRLLMVLTSSSMHPFIISLDISFMVAGISMMLFSQWTTAYLQHMNGVVNPFPHTTNHHQKTLKTFRKQYGNSLKMIEQLQNKVENEQCLHLWKCFQTHLMKRRRKASIWGKGLMIDD